MLTEAKISATLEAALERRKPNEKHDAIVVFRRPSSARTELGVEVRDLQQRLAAVEAHSQAQRVIQARVLGNFLDASSRRLKGDQRLTVETIGKAALPVAHVEVTRATLRELSKQRDVAAILPNQRVRLIEPKRVDLGTLGTAEAKAKQTWGLQRLEIDKVWAETRGKGVRVGVLDTGVFSDHPALSNRVKKFVVVDPLGRRVQALPAFDAGFHGTHVCGTIAGGASGNGVAIGVAPEAELLAAGVLIGDATLRTLLEGISWAVEEGADILNLSLGFTYYEPAFATVFDLLLEDYGVLPICAIGNENHGNTSSPGNARSALGVGALEKGEAGSEGVAFFSSGASLVFPGTSTQPVHKPDLVAPGVQVFSCIPPEQTRNGTVEYGYLDGTSMATPHVAGVAALLMAAKPKAPVRRIVEALRETAWHPGGSASRPDNRWGAGLVRPWDALQVL